MYDINKTVSTIKATAKEKNVSISTMLEEIGINKNTLSSMKSRGSWAENIRANFFDQMSNAPEKNKQIAAEIFNCKPEAKWWIEEINNKAEIDIRHVMRKCMDFATLDELQAYLISKM